MGRDLGVCPKFLLFSPPFLRRGMYFFTENPSVSRTRHLPLPEGEFGDLGICSGSPDKIIGMIFPRTTVWMVRRSPSSLRGLRDSRTTGECLSYSEFSFRRKYPDIPGVVRGFPSSFFSLLRTRLRKGKRKKHHENDKSFLILPFRFREGFFSEKILWRSTPLRFREETHSYELTWRSRIFGTWSR